MTTKALKVTIYSDLACPWCYVGQKRLRDAITIFQSKHHDTPLSITWKPYQIDPGTNIQGEGMEDYCRRRWGGSGWTHHLRSEGSKCGATFRDWKWWPNTLKAHQFVQFAEERYGVDTDRTNEVIFKALYEEGKNLSLISTLVEIGERELNIPPEPTRRYLESDEGLRDVKREIKKGKQMYQISGVPYFIIGRGDDCDALPYALSGAQSPNAFLRTFDKVLGEE